MTYPLVLVEWIDASKSQDGVAWEIDGGRSPNPFLNFTAGYLIKVMRDWIRIAGEKVTDSLDGENGWRDRHAFPREMVKKVTLLEVGAEWTWPEGE